MPRNPYRGLRAFTEADAPDFFGRSAIVRQVVDRFADAGPDARFVAVVGPSGCGKSSLVRAGVVPALRDGALGEPVLVTELSPGAEPYDELEAALGRVAVRAVRRLGDVIRGSSRGLLEAAELAIPGDTDVVIVIDQFEELFTLTTHEAVRTDFLECIRVACADPDSRVRVIATLRADFYDRPLVYPRFGELLASRTEAIPPLQPDELEQAIRGPAERAGVSLEPGLVAAMIADAAHQPGALPLIQFTLTESFDRQHDGCMTLATYRELGGIVGSLSASADEAVRLASRDERHAIRQVFLRLVALGEGRSDTRRRVARGALDSLDIEDATIDRVLDTFGRLRILTFDREPATREPTVEIAHEALLDAWPRLRRWIDEAREDLRQERVLIRVAGEWLAAGQDPSFLLRGARLEQAEAWLQKTDLALGHDVRRYVVASIAERTRERDADEQRRVRETEIERRSARRLRALVAVFAAAALVAGSLTLVATDQGRRAERAAAVSTVRELAAASVANLEGDPELAVLLAVEAVERSRAGAGAVAPEAEEALHRAIAASRIVATIPTARGPIATSVDGPDRRPRCGKPGPRGDLRPRRNAGSCVRCTRRGDHRHGVRPDRRESHHGRVRRMAPRMGPGRWGPPVESTRPRTGDGGHARCARLPRGRPLAPGRSHPRPGRQDRTCRPDDLRSESVRGPFAVGCAQSRWGANRDGHGTPERRRDRADRRDSPARAMASHSERRSMPGSTANCRGARTAGISRAPRSCGTPRPATSCIRPNTAPSREARAGVPTEAGWSRDPAGPLRYGSSGRTSSDRRCRFPLPGRTPSRTSRSSEAMRGLATASDAIRLWDVRLFGDAEHASLSLPTEYASGLGFTDTGTLVIAADTDQRPSSVF